MQSGAIWMLKFGKCQDSIVNKKYRESADRGEKTFFFFFHQKNPFGELFLEMTSKGSISFSSTQNLQNLKIRL